MHLQKSDYETAFVLQQELAKRCPDDKVIKEFATYLPDYVKQQMKIGNEDEEEYESEYDEESPEENSSSDKSSSEEE